MYSSPGSSTALVAMLIALLAGCSGKTFAATQPGEGGVPAFYAWTDKVPSTPGQMLRAEPLTPTQSLEKAGQNVRILYTSTDGLNNQPVVVSGALLIPEA